MRVIAAHTGIELAGERGAADGAGDDVAFFQIGHHCPIRQGGNAAAAGHELDDGDGELAVAARRVDASGQQDFSQ